MYVCESWTIKKADAQRIDVLEKTLESPLDCEEIKPVHPKGNQSWMFIGRTDAEAETPNTLATWCKELTPWKRCWCWERLKAGGKGDNRGWDDWMASPTWWTSVWISFRNWWWTGNPGVLQSMGSQRAGRDWETELNWRNISFLPSPSQWLKCVHTGLLMVRLIIGTILLFHWWNPRHR